DTQCTAMRCAVIVDVIESQELDGLLTTTRAANVAATVVQQRGISILPKPGLAVLVVANLAPGVRARPVGPQVEVANGFLLAALGAAFALDHGRRRQLQPARVVPPPRRTLEAVF